MRHEDSAPPPRCATLVSMEKWVEFERMVTAIHAVLDSAAYNVRRDVKITDPSGASHQIDA